MSGANAEGGQAPLAEEKSIENRSYKLIFLDRDGVINRDPMGGYVTKWSEFHFLPGALEALKKLTDNIYEIFIISNQAGVAKGLFSLQALDEITKNMLSEIERAGGRVKSVHYCVHTDEDNCNCRKPKTGLFRKATEGLEVDFGETYFIGDGLRDIEAGKAVGCRTILVLCGKTKSDDRDKWNVRPDYIKRDLLDAVNWLLKKNKI